MMPWTRLLIATIALMVGGFMLVDGTRALTVGDYFTPREGPYAGQLGPWAGLVSAIGVDPRGAPMKVAFVAFGTAWLAALAAFLRGRPSGTRALAVVAVATLWYLPVGTALSALLLLLLVVSARRRARTVVG
jgi:hypothetical protein